MVAKPNVFIGSSSEGLPVAEAVFAGLSRDTSPTLWTHQLFLPGEYPLEALEAQLRRHSFAVLVASPDDQLLTRGETAPAMRDNLLLEFGLFAGVLGRRHAFFVCPDQPAIHLPSDLAGVVVAHYDGHRAALGASERAAAVQVACQQIREAIHREWDLQQRTRAQMASQVRASEKGRALQRLHYVVMQLRDGMVVVQRDALASLSNEQTFNALKVSAVNKVEEILTPIRPDAVELGIEPEVKALEQATIAALQTLPFPQELTAGSAELRHRVVDSGLGALNVFLGGGDPIRHLEGAVSRETEARVDQLRHRYSEWWDSVYPAIADATTALQDRLFSVAIQLGSMAAQGQ
ncbi:MAG TPA: nucleotide-binding protein [Vicinamibacterales bacterium]|jgi:hypothetical protein|nr:nucleotide-binding protein [Vicinamibacterales bacterium]